MFRKICLLGSDEGQGSEKDQMLLKVVETSSDQLSSQNNGYKLPLSVSNGKQTRTKKGGDSIVLYSHISKGHIILQPDNVLSPSLGPENSVLTNESNFLWFHNEHMFQQSTSS